MSVPHFPLGCSMTRNLLFDPRPETVPAERRINNILNHKRAVTKVQKNREKPEMQATKFGPN
jgi:hypothetical protein